MDEKADGSVVLTQMQVSFLWERNKNGPSMWSAIRPSSKSCCRLRSGHLYIMACHPDWTNSAGMLSTPA